MPRVPADPPLANGAPAFEISDLIAVAVIFCVGVWLGTRAVEAFRESGGRASFYQSEFGPAVMMACGRGLQNPDAASVPALAAFLSERADAFECGDLPPTIGAGALGPFQRASRYLEVTVATMWRVTGVSWSRLAVLSGILFGSVAALSYGVFRLALSRSLALLGMVPTFMSTSNLMLAPNLRDYAKGPFLLAVILIMGYLVLKKMSALRAIGWSAAGGAVVGLGLGFRTDLMIAVAPVLLVLCLLAPSLAVGARAAAVAAFLGVFALVAWPILGDYSHGNNIGPVALLGLTEPFDRSLGVQPSIYEFGSQYNDSLVFSIVNSYAVRVEGRRAGVGLGTPEHGAASMRYLEEIARTFPGDFVTRTLAATRGVPTYFLESSLSAPPWLAPGFIRTIYRLRGSVSSRLAPVAGAGLAAATILISAVNPRAAWLIVVVMVGFAGASAIQFHERHFFYLQLIPWCAFGLIAQVALHGRRRFGEVTRLHVKRAAVFTALVMAGVGGALLLTRLYQQETAARLFESYQTAPRTPLPLVQSDVATSLTRFTNHEWLEPLPPDSPWVVTRFLAVQFRDDLCGLIDLPLTLRYEAVLPELDFSEHRSVRLAGGAPVPTTLFFAIFDRSDGSSRFRGVEVAAGQSRCVGGIARVDRLDRTPLLLTTVLAAAWRDRALYQRQR
jgi:hypothetical protein